MDTAKAASLQNKKDTATHFTCVKLSDSKIKDNYLQFKVRNIFNSLTW